MGQWTWHLSKALKKLTEWSKKITDRSGSRLMFVTGWIVSSSLLQLPHHHHHHQKRISVVTYLETGSLLCNQVKMRSLGSTLMQWLVRSQEEGSLDTDTPGAHHAEIHRHRGKIAAWKWRWRPKWCCHSQECLRHRHGPTNTLISDLWPLVRETSGGIVQDTHQSREGFGFSSSEMGL